MTEASALNIALSIVAVFFSLLILIIGWLGNKIYEKIEEMSSNISKMTSELHEKINGIDRRLTRVETTCNRKTFLKKENCGV